MDSEGGKKSKLYTVFINLLVYPKKKKKVLRALCFTHCFMNYQVQMWMSVQ